MEVEELTYYIWYYISGHKKEGIFLYLMILSFFPMYVYHLYNQGANSGVLGIKVCMDLFITSLLVQNRQL